MNTGMRMFVLANRGGMESKYRDRRGREHRENGEYAVRNYSGMNNREMDMESGGYGGTEMGMDNMESRRRRDSRGRFRSDWEDGMEMRRGGDSGGRNEMRSGYGEREMRSEMRGYPNRPFPVYEGGDGMNQIGFNAGREIETDYRMNATHQTGNEMEYKSTPKMGGGSSSGMSMSMNKEMAEEWTSKMKNEDGTKGPHWKMEQVKQIMAQKGIDANPFEFFAILNAMYSDYCAVLKKHGVNTMDMYVDLACAFLNDSDAISNKATMYYECLVKK